MDTLTILCIVATLQVILYYLTYRKIKAIANKLLQEKRKNLEYFKENK